MKLKKIASLMLAGVMAVSMLAGCQNTNVDPEPTPNPDPTPVTGYSAKLQSELSAIAADHITFSDDNDLNNALEYAVGNVGNNAITGGFLANMMKGVVEEVKHNDKTAFGLVRAGLRDALDVKFDSNKDDKNIVLAMNPDGNKDWANYYKNDDVNNVILYVVDGGVDLNNAMDQIAGYIGNELEQLDDDYVAAGDNSDVNYNYTGSVATCTKTYEAGHGMSVHFIAVELVRHIGK